MLPNTGWAAGSTHWHWWQVSHVLISCPIDTCLLTSLQARKQAVELMLQPFPQCKCSLDCLVFRWPLMFLSLVRPSPLWDFHNSLTVIKMIKLLWRAGELEVGLTDQHYDLLSFASFQDQAAEDLRAGYQQYSCRDIKIPTNCSCSKTRDYTVASKSQGIGLYACRFALWHHVIAWLQLDWN